MEHYKNLSLELLTGYDPDGNFIVEEFRDIPDYEGLYQASTFGRIKSLSKNGKIDRILKASADTKGYLRVCIRKEGKQAASVVHIIVAKTFIPNPENKPQVNHKKGIKTDNRVSELEWMTNRENCEHYRIKQKTSSIYVGVRFHKVAKKWDARIQYNKTDIYLGLYETEYEAHLAYQQALKEINDGTFVPPQKRKYTHTL